MLLPPAAAALRAEQLASIAIAVGVLLLPALLLLLVFLLHRLNPDSQAAIRAPSLISVGLLHTCACVVIPGQQLLHCSHEEAAHLQQHQQWADYVSAACTNNSSQRA